jgi:hypothetical protein
VSKPHRKRVRWYWGPIILALLVVVAFGFCSDALFDDEDEQDDLMGRVVAEMADRGHGDNDGGGRACRKYSNCGDHKGDTVIIIDLTPGDDREPAPA